MAIITISREMGTGALEIAKEVAKRLKYTLVDNAKIAELAPQYGLDAQTLERLDEKPPTYLTTEDMLQAANLYTIELIYLDLVKKGNAVLYGRAVQDLLRGMENVLRVRIIAPFDERVEKFAEREWIDPDLARDLIRKSDHQRGGFIHFYFDRNWQDPLGYDLVCNTSRLAAGAVVDCIVAAVKDPRLKAAEADAMEMLEDITVSKRAETEILKSGLLQGVHFKISAQNGVVLLSGHVHTEEERRTAIKIIGKVKGVRRIEDTLQVLTYKPYKE